MKKVGIIGATGYAGVELIRILLSHPEVEIAGISSVSFEGKKISEVYPAFKDVFDNVLTAEDDVIDNCDVIFASLPHGLSEKIAKKVDAKGKILIDLGADFRLYDEADYTEWYGLSYEEKDLHKKAVYALPEIFRNDIKGKKIIGNPGCYPTSVALALAPALANKLISTNAIIIDSKSGVTGAGRGLTQKTHYPDCNEAFSPYKVASHRHTPEIEQTLSAVAGEDVKITFVPHLLPLNRGIVSTIYADLVKDVDVDELISIYKNYYKDEFFVRVLDKDAEVNLKNVRMSNFCDISLFVDKRTNRMVVVSAIDNMVKGAAGQAIQNMNIALNLDEKTGLMMVPPSF